MYLDEPCYYLQNYYHFAMHSMIPFAYCFHPPCTRGHSTTTLTKFYPILTPSPLEWTIVDILHDTYPLSRDQAWTFY